jgi:hypothetical protein
MIPYLFFSLYGREVFNYRMVLKKVLFLVVKGLHCFKGRSIIEPQTSRELKHGTA